MKKIFLDPGHGGEDPGAVANGIIEKSINLKVAFKVAEILSEKGFEIGMSRTGDQTLSLTERCNIANARKADLFISIHHNAGGGDGYECIHSVNHGVGENLARAIAFEFDKLGQNSHGTKAVYCREGKNGDYYTVIAKTAMPAVITEYAFLDTKDVQSIDTEEELFGEARAIAAGVCKYLGVV